VTGRLGWLALSLALAAGCRGGGDAPADDAATLGGTGAAATECEPARAADPGPEPRTIAAGGLRREYVVHVPPDYDGSKPAPLVFNLHGFGGDIASQDTSTDLPALAGERGYIVVTPQGAPLDVPDDAHGVLQDVHWSGGAIGYFPTYSLGNVISVQIWERAKQDLGDLDERFEQGEFGELRDWLTEHLYRMGRKFTPQETIERVTGSRIDAKPYVRYLREKLAPQPA